MLPTCLLALASLGVSADASAAARALPYPEDWPALQHTRSLRGASRDCTLLSGRYRDLPRAIEDAGHRLESLALSDLLHLSRPLRTPPSDRADGEPVRPHQWQSEQRARDVIRLEVAPDGALRAALEAVAAAPAYSAAASSRCRPGGELDVEAPPLNDPQPAMPEGLFALMRTGAERVRVQLLPTANGDLIARIDVIARLRGFQPIGYAAVKRYWLRFERVAPDA